MIGVRHALQRGRGRSTVPVGTALLGMALAVTALCGTAVFGASLSHLTATPKLYGESFQINFNLSDGEPDPPLLRDLEHDPALTGLTRGLGSEISIGKVTVGAVAATALRGTPLLSTVTGHLPRGDGQVALGTSTMRQVGAKVGSVVPVTVTAPSGAKRTVAFRVVSEVAFPVLQGIAGLGDGALFTIPGYLAAVCPPGPKQGACRQAVIGNSNGGMLASFVSGARGKAAINHYLDTYAALSVLPVTPVSLVNFGEAVNFPLIFGVMLALFGAATLLHLLVVSVARRRREVGLLKVLGFVNNQVACRGVLAGVDTRHRRDRHRRATGVGDRTGGVEGVRLQPGRRAGVGGAGRARGGRGGRRPRRRQPPRRGAGAGRVPLAAGTAPAGALSRRRSARRARFRGPARARTGIRSIVGSVPWPAGEEPRARAPLQHRRRAETWST